MNIQTFLLYILPVVIFFSYHPVITVGEDSTMNLEFSVTLIWLLIFSIISLPSIYKFLRYNCKKEKWPILLSLLFPLYSSVAIIWSENFLRAVLTSGVIWCLWLSVISIISFFKTQQENENLKRNLLKIFFFSTTLVCLFCWVQCIFDITGIPRENSLLCAGCTIQSFGFPHPNGFAIEPQFMGNLLLAPVFLASYLFLNTSQGRKKIYFFLLTLLFSSTLFLTMSRGAIYAFVIGLIILLIIKNKNQKTLKSLVIIPIVVFSFLFTLVFQGICAEISPTNDTFLSGTSKVLSQMSLGIIDIPYELESEKSSDDAETITPQFDGYVEVSTTTRLGLSELAFKTWTSSPTIFIFGAGTGSAGKAMHAFSPESLAEKEIVQNEYLEIALELGLIGIIILFLDLAFLIKIALKKEHEITVIPILASFLVSYLFFSGLPNSIHIFLLPTLLIASTKKSN